MVSDDPNPELRLFTVTLTGEYEDPPPPPLFNPFDDNVFTPADMIYHNTDIDKRFSGRIETSTETLLSNLIVTCSQVFDYPVYGLIRLRVMHATAIFAFDLIQYAESR